MRLYPLIRDERDYPQYPDGFDIDFGEAIACVISGTAGP